MTPIDVRADHGVRDWRGQGCKRDAEVHMPGPLLYLDTSNIRAGALEKLKGAIKELVEFIESNEPQLLAYNVYLSDDGSQMTVTHEHMDTESLEYHMDVAGPAFAPFADLLTLSSISVYGEPSDKALRQLHDKAKLLGSGNVSVHMRHAGFTRFGAASGKA